MHTPLLWVVLVSIACAVVVVRTQSRAVAYAAFAVAAVAGILLPLTGMG